MGKKNKIINLDADVNIVGTLTATSISGEVGSSV
jgi:hypothetical protein